MRRIGFVIGTMRGGGAQRVVSVLSSYFAEKEYKVSIITTSDNICDYEISKKVQLCSLHAHTSLKGIKQLVCFIKLMKHLKNGSYDYVVAFLPMTCIYVAACKVLGCKFKYIASERMDPKQDPDSMLLRRLRDWSYGVADGLVYQTEDAQNHFPSSWKKKSKIIYNPINTQIPTPYSGEREKRIVTAVRLEKQKNLEMLIEAFKIFNSKHPEYILEVYGKGTLKADLERRIREYGLENDFLLKGFANDIYERMRKASFFVLSSDYEGVSNSMLEALCIGLPVVSTDHPIGGAKMFIKHGENGYLTPVGDSAAFADAMDKFVSLDEYSKKQMSIQAQSIRSELHPQKVCEQWEAFITNKA